MQTVAAGDRLLDIHHTHEAGGKALRRIFVDNNDGDVDRHSAFSSQRGAGENVRFGIAHVLG